MALSRDYAGAGVQKAPRRRATLEVSTPVPQAEGVAGAHVNVSTRCWCHPPRAVAPEACPFSVSLLGGPCACTCLSSVGPSASVPPSSQDAHLSHHPLMGSSVALFSEKTSWPLLPQAGSCGVHLSCPVPGAWWGLRRAVVPRREFPLELGQRALTGGSPCLLEVADPADPTPRTAFHPGSRGLETTPHGGSFFHVCFLAARAVQAASRACGPVSSFERLVHSFCLPRVPHRSVGVLRVDVTPPRLYEFCFRAPRVFSFDLPACCHAELFRLLRCRWVVLQPLGERTLGTLLTSETLPGEQRGGTDMGWQV